MAIIGVRVTDQKVCLRKTQSYGETIKAHGYHATHTNHRLGGFLPKGLF